MTTFFRLQGGYCGEVRLYLFICLFYCSQRICSFHFQCEPYDYVEDLVENMQVWCRTQFKIFESSILFAISQTNHKFRYYLFSRKQFRDAVRLICQINLLFVCLFQLCVANKSAPFVGDQFVVYFVCVLVVCLFVCFFSD